MENTPSREKGHREEGLSALRNPSGRDYRMVVVGAGQSGLVATNSLLRAIEAEKEVFTRTGVGGGASRFLGLQSLSLLSGGNSLAFSPVSGSFGSFLTLSGCDHIRRDVQLEGFQNFVSARLSKHGFSFHPGVSATRITLDGSKAFRLETSSDKGSRLLAADKLVLALGHTLKERPTELGPYLFRGAAEICQRLEEQRPIASCPKECLARVLSNLRPMPDGRIRIGLVGLGSSFLEVVKIFHTLLDPPDADVPLYRVSSKGCPVDFVLYDSRLSGASTPENALIDGIEIFLSNVRNPDISNSAESDALFAQYKDKERGRISSLVRTGQLKVVPHRFDWSRLSVDDGVLSAHSQNGQSAGLSAVVDCSPFQVGLSWQQKTLLANISALEFSKHPEGGWLPRVIDPAFNNRLALIGAPFTTKDGWAMGPILARARTMVDEFFPRTGATSREDELRTHAESQPYDQ